MRQMARRIDIKQTGNIKRCRENIKNGKLRMNSVKVIKGQPIG